MYGCTPKCSFPSILDRLWTYLNKPPTLSDSESDEEPELNLNQEPEEELETVDNLKRRLSSESSLNETRAAFQNSFRGEQDVEVREPVDHFSPVQVRFPVNAPALRPPPSKMVAYDVENKEDGEDYYNRLKLVKAEWDPDVLFWFNAVEAQMKRAQIFKQWTKRETLMTLLPANVLSEVRYLYRLSEAEAGTKPYKDIKDAIIKIFAPKPKDSIDKALSRVLTVRPSLLGKQLIEDICKCKPALKSQCCADVVFGLFRRQLPTAVRNKIAGEPFTKDTYQEVFDIADDVFESNQPDSQGASTVAAVASASEGAVGGDVSAIRGGFPGRGRGQFRGGRRGGRGNRGGQNRGNQSNNSGTSGGGNQSQTQNQSQPQGQSQGQPRNKGPRHPDAPPPQVCQSHWSFGKTATFCRKPLSCPWVNIIAAD